MLTAERVREVLNYEPETGIFTWRKKPSRKTVVGSVAGCVGSNGHNKRILMGIDGTRQFGHRVAWLYMTGSFPPPGMVIDHINGDGTDNRWANLRLATHTENQGNRKANKNNSSGVKGVEWLSALGKWRAKIRSAGRNIHLGVFDNKDDAARAYMVAAENKFGEFATSGERVAPGYVK